MTLFPTRGRRTRLPLAVAAALVASAWWALALVPVDAAARAGRADPTVTVALTTFEPVTVRPDRRLQVGGLLSTDRRLRGVVVQLEVGTTAYLSRSLVADAVADASGAVTTPVPGATDRVGAVPAGSAAFTLRVPTNTLPLAASGVYPLRLRVTAVRDGVTSTVATLDTFLPWSPRHQGVRPTRLLWVWPLVDRPRRDAEGAFIDEDLATELTPGGRLSRLVAAGSGRQVTWVIDPALLADVDALGHPYRVVGTAGRTRPANQDARRWLSDLRTATAGADLVALPFADPDLVGIIAAARTGLLHDARVSGVAPVAATLGRPARFDVAWPADGFADEATLAALPTSGFSAVLLDGEAVPVTTAPAWTPSGRADLVDGTLPALLTDPALDAVVNHPGSGRSALLLSRQAFLAQTLLLTMELPSDPRLAVVAPERRWDPDPSWPAVLLDAADQATWLRPVTLDQALQREAPTVAREQPRLPEAVAEFTVSDQLVDGAARAHVGLTRFRAILTDPTPASLMNQSLLASVSSSWRYVPEVAQVRLDATTADLDAARGKVRIVTRHATLSAQSAPLPVTIRNQLDQPVRVRLDVVSADPLRLRVTGPTELLTIKAGSSLSVSVQLDAVTTGRSDVVATLRTRAGDMYSAPVTLPVDVRAYGRVALIVFGLAAALLVLAAGRRIVRRIRGARGSGQEA